MKAISLRAVESALWRVNREPVDRRIFLKGDGGCFGGDHVVRSSYAVPCTGPCFALQFPSLNSSHRFVANLSDTLAMLEVEDPNILVMRLMRDLEFGTAQQCYVLHFPGWTLERN